MNTTQKTALVIGGAIIGYYIYRKYFTQVTSDQLTRTLQNSPLKDYTATPEWETPIFSKILPAGTYPEEWGYKTLKKPAAYESTLSPGSTVILAPTPGGTTSYMFGPGDWEKLNFAQKILLNIPGIPTNWVLG